jgi:hypothetical protein
MEGATYYLPEPGRHKPTREFRWPEWLTSENVWGVVGLLVGGFATLVILVGFIQHMTKPEPTPEQLEQQRIQREAKERREREADRILDAAREAQIQAEMERQRNKRGF